MIKVLITMFFATTMALAKYISMDIDESIMNDKNIQIIDIRTSNEWQYGVLRGAILVNLTDNNGYYNEKFLDNIKSKIDPNKKIAIICRSGNRSQKASQILVDNGYKDVINLSGGMLLATQKGLDIVKP
ncbi:MULTISPECIES: rhodanese-like domain-containing protein [Campylobacter]|uniref:Rhodanese-like domain-containing protein n=1 Tax=Campylobacter vicugnae TaxID=1660076 RepID=A0ABZ2E9X3_9BACT|nr:MULTISPECIES: rhodanese-like domain-containing protein [unclassified Campylobacter]ARR03926.1 putative rhodanese-related sulfurtransferase [Campylobacter sp. RM12175]MCR8689897.1 rhodanese-like domain-containing protein [Campylobacter sp. RM9264]MCR8700505.1 rhodanese-like domain-containing protein [Campylobacter sp. RM12176]